MVSLVSLTGNILIDTAEPIEAALLAPNGRLEVARPIDIQIKGLVAASKLVMTGMNAASKKLVYEPSFDWADGGSSNRSFRIMLEQVPHVFVAKLQ